MSRGRGGEREGGLMPVGIVILLISGMAFGMGGNRYLKHGLESNIRNGLAV